MPSPKNRQNTHPILELINDYNTTPLDNLDQVREFNRTHRSTVQSSQRNGSPKTVVFREDDQQIAARMLLDFRIDKDIHTTLWQATKTSGWYKSIKDSYPNGLFVIKHLAPEFLKRSKTQKELTPQFFIELLKYYEIMDAFKVFNYRDHGTVIHLCIRHNALSLVEHFYSLREEWGVWLIQTTFKTNDFTNLDLSAVKLNCYEYAARLGRFEAFCLLNKINDGWSSNKELTPKVMAALKQAQTVPNSKEGAEQILAYLKEKYPVLIQRLENQEEAEAGEVVFDVQTAELPAAEEPDTFLLDALLDQPTSPEPPTPLSPLPSPPPHPLLCAILDANFTKCIALQHAGRVNLAEIYLDDQGTTLFSVAMNSLQLTQNQRGADEWIVHLMKTHTLEYIKWAQQNPDSSSDRRLTVALTQALQDCWGMQSTLHAKGEQLRTAERVNSNQQQQLMLQERELGATASCADDATRQAQVATMEAEEARREALVATERACQLQRENETLKQQIQRQATVLRSQRQTRHQANGAHGPISPPQGSSRSEIWFQNGGTATRPTGQSPEGRPETPYKSQQAGREQEAASPPWW